MSERIVLVGGGAQSFSVGSMLLDCAIDVAGYIDQTSTALPWPYFGDDDTCLAGDLLRSFQLVMGVGFDTALRARLFKKFVEAGRSFFTFVHPRATVMSNATLGAGCIIYPNCFIGANAILGDNVTMCAGSSIDHDCTIGDHCYISPAVAVAGNTVLGEACAVGINATFVEGLRIARRTTVGAAALMLKDVDIAGLTYAGVPAAPIRKG